MTTPGNCLTSPWLVRLILFLISFPLASKCVVFGQEIPLERKVISTNAYYNNLFSSTGSGTGMENIDEYNRNKSEILNEVRQLEKTIAIDTQSIKIAFHILYTDDISKAQDAVQSQLAALNRDFSGTSHTSEHPNDPNGNYLKLAAPANLSFDLASTNMDAQFGRGIVEVKSGKDSWSDWEEMKEIPNGGSSALRSDSIINIWVCKLPDGFGSYATRPYLQGSTDGIVLDYRLFSNSEETSYPNHQGKTLTHLIGNFLGLDPLWGSGIYCTDDEISDTPVHNAPNMGTPKHNHISICASHLRQPEMVMNFMDSTDDELQTMFTEGQVRRMHAMIMVARSGLIDPIKNNPK